MYRKILVAIDGSTASNLGLDEAIRLAKNQGARLRLFHLVDEFAAVSGPDSAALYSQGLIEALRRDGERIMDKAEGLVRRKGIKAEAVMLESFGGKAADAIVAQARKWGADLIVLGTHGRRGVKRLVMGSDAEEVVRTAPAPVLLVRARPRRSVAKRSRTKP